MSTTQIVLLERVEGLGNMGDVVSVRSGYARNFLLPQNKALRATKSNLAFFEAQRHQLEAENEKRKSEASKRAEKMNNLDVVIVRQASEGGQLYGSVTARDIAEAVSAIVGEKIEKGTVELNQSFKTIGIFPVNIRLHAEVKVEVSVNVARNDEEAKVQKKTGKALIADEFLTKQEQDEKVADAEEATEAQETEQEVATEEKSDEQAA